MPPLPVGRETRSLRDPFRPEYMDRDRNTVMKVWKACDSSIIPEFKLKKSEENDMHSFKTELNNTLKNYGCDSVFYMLKNSQFVYLLESPDALSIGEIRAQEVAYRAACQYDDQNLDLDKLLLKNSTDSSICKSLHHHILCREARTRSKQMN